jgi:CysZ protein
LLKALALAFGQLSDPRIQKYIWASIAIAAGVFVGLILLIWYLLGAVTGLDGIWADAAQYLGLFAAIVAAWFTFPIVTATMSSLFSDQVIDAVMARHYPGRSLPYKVTVVEMLLDGVKLGLLALVVNLLALPLLLFIPPAYPVIAYGLNGYLLGREYFEMPAFRRLPRDQAKALFRREKGRFVFAGVVIAFLATIPILNLIAPILGIAFMVHIFESVINLEPRPAR